MDPRQIPLDRLLRALPSVAGLAPLREAVLGASTADPSRAWPGQAAYGTYEARVLAAERLDEVVEAAREAARRRVDRLIDGVAGALRASAADDVPGLVRHMVSLGEAAEGEESLGDALVCYEAASGLALQLGDRRPLALALRRTARVRWTMGEVETAWSLYRSSLEQAEAADDVKGRIIASTGLGNVRHSQGRWAEAREHYAAALPLCGDDHPVLLGHICLNLANVSRLEGRLEEARDWLDRAVARFDHFGPADQTIWFNNEGLLRMESGDVERAETAFRQALERAASPFERAMVYENLADVALRRDRLDEAEGQARRAEEEALRAGSPWALAAVYTALGRICRLRGDANGFAFFEKALELCRERGYQQPEALALLEYGLYRRDIGDAEEGRLYLERARERFAELGAGPDRERAERELAALAASPEG